MIKLKLILENKPLPLNSSERIMYYNERKKNKIKIPQKYIDDAKDKSLGIIAGMNVFLVNGDFIRTYIDIDYVEGGNPARYTYIPDKEIWVEKILSKIDLYSTIVHEIIEYHLMMKGNSYDKSHDITNTYEFTFRHKVFNKEMNLKEVEKYITTILNKKEILK